MNRLFSVLAAAGILIAIPTAQALSVDELLRRKPQKVEDAVPGTLNERLYKRLSKAQQFMADGKHDQAVELLTALAKSARSNPYAAAQVYQTFGYTYAQKDDFANAARYFQLCLDQKALPLQPTLSTMFSLAQVLVAQEQFVQSIPLMQDYIFNRDEPNPDSHFFLGQLWAQVEQKIAATKEVEKAVKLSAQPKETWLRLLSALYYEQKKFSQAAAVLERLIKINPNKKEYWKQLSSIYISADKDERALATLEVAEKKGFLTEEKEIIQLVRLSIFRGVPYKGGRYLEAGIESGVVNKTQKHFELLADAWIQAQELEMALSALSKAAPLAKDGAVYVRQGQLYLEREEWESSVKALQAGIGKGGLKKPGLAFVALGIAQFKLGYVEASIQSFQKALAYPNQKRQATEWINHLNSLASTSH